MSAVRRVAGVIRLKPERRDEYVRLHADAWPEVLARLSQSNVTNYSIYLHEGWLFSYYEYVGQDHDADMAAIAADPVTQRWWRLTGPCQERLDTAAPGEHWASMREVFHHD